MTDDIVARIVRELIAKPPAERMQAFTAAMVALRERLAKANPRASKRELAARGHQLALKILNSVTASLHKKSLAAFERKIR